MNDEMNDSPIRMTVCDSIADVKDLIRDLREVGFTADEISVVCSQESCEREFAEFIHEHPAGAEAGEALSRSGAAALGLGAAAVMTGLLTTAGTALVVVGAFSGLAIAGTFVALMMTRGAEKELADFYDQAVTHGKILVAVETEDPARQQLADRIIRQEGRNPVAIPKESSDGR